MKLTKLLLAIVSSCAIVIALTQPATAALVDVTQPVAGQQTFTYLFSPAETGTVDATITDFLHPAPFAFLYLAITQGSHFIADSSVSNSFPFSATAGLHYVASVFAVAGNTTGGFAFSLYNLNITQREITPIPEPGAWLMMLGGIGLLGWLRLRKSENLLR